MGLFSHPLRFTFKMTTTFFFTPKMIVRRLQALLIVLLAPFAVATAQEFRIVSDIPGLPEGLAVGLLTQEDSTVEVVNDTVRNGRFELRGHLSHPQLCTLVTNNLGLLPPDNEDMSKIRWTYTSIFVSDTLMTFQADHYDSIDSDKPLSASFRVTGGQPQTDFNQYNEQLRSAQKAGNIDVRKFNMNFIAGHPHSVVSLWLADAMLMQATPRLSKSEVEHLQSLITTVPDDEQRLALFHRHCKAAASTAVGLPVAPLPLVDRSGKQYSLTEVVPHGKYVLIDFWASWCGICRAQIPEVKDLLKHHSDQLTVVGVSDDRNKAAWLKALDKEQMTWSQYQLTPEGGKRLLSEYLIVGVPYYLLVGPDGKVLAAPGRPAEVEDFLK